MFFGILLIIVGAFFLLKNLGIISGDLWSVFWPTIIIIIGIRTLVPSRWRRLWKQGKGLKIKIDEEE
jgi:hypothetical protein